MVYIINSHLNIGQKFVVMCNMLLSKKCIHECSKLSDGLMYSDDMCGEQVIKFDCETCEISIII